MAFTTPRTWVAFEIPTAAIMNTHIRDNLVDLDARANISASSVDTSQSRSGTTYGDLGTVGPSITMVTGTKAYILIAANVNSPTSGVAYMAVAVSGATTLAANDSRALRYESVPITGLSYGISFTGLTPGSNTFTAKYRSSSGNSMTWGNRTIAGWPSTKLS